MRKLTMIRMARPAGSFRGVWVAWLLVVGLLACDRAKPDPCADDDPAIGKIPVKVVFTRHERPFFQIQKPADAVAFLNRDPLFARQFLLRRQYPSDSFLANQLTHLATNDGLRKLGREVAQTFGAMQPEQAMLRTAFQHVKHYFPDFREPRVYTFVSGMSQDLLVKDSLMVLGLDFFAGPKASFRPNVPSYILRRYQRPYLVPQAVLQIANKYLQQNFADRSLLNQMVQAGKAYYFLEKVLPCVPDTLKIGFSGRELAGADYNEARIWLHFVTKKLLYETQPFVVQKYVGERPRVPEVGKECPGRIGAWVGWQIVRAYMAENPQITLRELLAEKDAQKILTGSKYKPRKHVM